MAHYREFIEKENCYIAATRHLETIPVAVATAER
jgi:hypothetical protein